NCGRAIVRRLGIPVVAIRDAPLLVDIRLNWLPSVVLEVRLLIIVSPIVLRLRRTPCSGVTCHSKGTKRLIVHLTCNAQTVANLIAAYRRAGFVAPVAIHLSVVKSLLPQPFLNSSGLFIGQK